MFFVNNMKNCFTTGAAFFIEAPQLKAFVLLSGEKTLTNPTEWKIKHKKRTDSSVQ